MSMNFTDRQQFRKIFNKNVSDFVSDIPGLNFVESLNLVGLDIIKFDKWINPPDGISCAQVVKEKYGDIASTLIEKLITGS